ncbi:hypothetical protein KW805_02950 [Candidatus Pacearchaeota archaeon]|nr:hypothetical protein [Candidatus Pacearchaeota archaeon]
MNGWYVVGSVVLFIGFFWMFLPHIAHERALSPALGHEDEHESTFHHTLDILLGLIGVELGLIMMVASNNTIILK